MANNYGTLTTVYYLLMARYGSNHINSDYPDQWRLKVMSTIFMYAPTWAKRLSIQDAMRNLSDEDLARGNIMTYNSAANPDTEPTTETWDTLPGINSQNKTLTKRGKLESLAMVDQVLRTDVTKNFLDRFRPLFYKIAAPALPLTYDLTETYPTGGDAALGFADGDGASLDVYGTYWTNSFGEMFPTFQDFADYYTNCGIPTTIPVA